MTSDTRSAAVPETRLLLSSPADVLAAVPYLIGFHPADSLVVIGLTGRPPGGRLHLTTRWDLPLPSGALGGLATLLRRERVDQIVIVGYGPGSLVTAPVDQVRELAGQAGVRVTDALRAEHGRYWSYVCESTACCPAEGTPYDARAGRIAAEATMNGLLALPDRAALLETVAPVTGPARLTMLRATERAVAGVRDMMAARGDQDAFAREFVADGLHRVRSAVETYRAGRRLDDDESARLGLALTVIRIRDEAWTLVDDAGMAAHQALWNDLTCRLAARFVPPVASLLGMVAWRSGNCALAGLAVERALAIDPRYSMAALLAQALQHMVPPGVLRERMPTPADLDREMGEPRAAWLRPMLELLDTDTCRDPDVPRRPGATRLHVGPGRPGGDEARP
jgi:hypothetical protein